MSIGTALAYQTLVEPSTTRGEGQLDHAWDARGSSRLYRLYFCVQDDFLNLSENLAECTGDLR